MDINGFTVNISHLGGPHFLIKIISPDKITFLSQIQANNFFSEQAALDYFKNNRNSFVIDLEN